MRIFSLSSLFSGSRRLFLISNSSFLFLNGFFFKVSHSYFMDAISSQIFLKIINLRGFALFCFSSLLSPECSVALRVIFLFILFWSFFFPIAGFMGVLNWLAILGCPFIFNGDANECTNICMIINSMLFLLCVQEQGLVPRELWFRVLWQGVRYNT